MDVNDKITVAHLTKSKNNIKHTHTKKIQEKRIAKTNHSKRNLLAGRSQSETLQSILSENRQQQKTQHEQTKITELLRSVTSIIQ